MNTSPEYLRQCLIETILGWRDRARITAFIELWNKKHGFASTEKLRADLNAEKERMRARLGNVPQPKG